MTEDDNEFEFFSRLADNILEDTEEGSELVTALTNQVATAIEDEED